MVLFLKRNSLAWDYNAARAEVQDGHAEIV
jgi:hypothetical protein